ncbi:MULTISPECIES: HAMP domain-containing sensor histidine kinase [unclassified Streptomyces]|uniref:sensor histidine kinase n=1 Tax=unclassified Streptomyces TaxID=2593676 RepID=UPI000DC7C86C|nr:MULTISPECIES: HAMP domain-containing sensor histidine kinase [unclassified Streptomyces]AWZ08393.1 two-component sensor histidine kinase [Streptomyces sp. ICC4]AWZ16395.1 two-component sensor histidine kinase [Streptomyces sp. ICC1]
MIKLRNATVGRRFTILYAGVFLLSGAVLLGLTFLLSGSDVTQAAPGQPLPGGGTGPVTAQHVLALERELAQVHGRQSRQLLYGSFIAMAVMAAVSLLLGRVLAGRVLRPLRLITAATRRISAENLHQRLDVAGPADEVKELADTVDGLLIRLEASFAAQRRFVANASHELRTPLATMRASLDVAVAKPEPAPQTVLLADRVRTELDRVDRLLDGFLVLARAQHAVLPDPEPVSLGALVGEALSARAADIAAKGLTVEEGVRPEAWTRGSPALLSRLVQNLVDNAIVHNREGGWIRIATEDEDEGGGGGADARLVVETGGSLLDQEQVDRLTQPFERLGTDRTGSRDSSGLGLSIVAAIVAAHGGSLDLRARPQGGLAVTAALPPAAGAPGGRAGVAS